MQILLEQLIAVGTTIAYSFIVTFLILFILKITVGLRTSILEEANGIKL
jgi:ammonia channel protein AmtB